MHIANILKEGELNKDPVVENYLATGSGLLGIEKGIDMEQRKT
jgi:hypothetical protein